MKPSLSIIIPTRERASYLAHSIKTCTDNAYDEMEIIVLDNASNDNTQEVMSNVADNRVRYFRNDSRLSMRDNFEKGIELSTGDVLCFIGDDDGVFPFTADVVANIFNNNDIDALSAARAHYSWPDLLSGRRNTALLPRGNGFEIYNSRDELRNLLKDDDYYRLPCLYHGFVRRKLVDRVKQRQGRFFLSSQVDMFSSIALSMEGVSYGFSNSPFIINGGSSRSNGASHFGGGTNREKNLWKTEDDLGFLPGFTNTLTIGALIIESAIRYSEGIGGIDLADMFESSECFDALRAEELARLKVGRSKADSIQPFIASGVSRVNTLLKCSVNLNRFSRKMRSFIRNYPIDMDAFGVKNIHQAVQVLTNTLEGGSTSVFNNPIAQFDAALKIARI